MSRCRRLTAFLFIVSAVALVGPPPAGAEAARNHVTVVNHADSRVASGARAAVTLDHSPSVDDENIAFARAGCIDCRTVAVAVQVVTMEGSVSDFRPVNAAVAVNEECSRCETYAYARQEVIAVDGGFALSTAGREEVRRLEDEIERVASSGEPFFEMGAQLDGLAVQVRELVRAELERAGRRETGRSARRAVDIAA